jgi:hypothetical protein
VDINESWWMLTYCSGGQGVVGSNPIVPTNKINGLAFCVFAKFEKIDFWVLIRVHFMKLLQFKHSQQRMLIFAHKNISKGCF